MKKLTVILIMAVAAFIFSTNDASAWGRRGYCPPPAYHGYGHHYRGDNLGNAVAAGVVAGVAAGLVEGTVRAMTSPQVVYVVPAPAMCLRNGVYVPCGTPPPPPPAYGPCYYMRNGVYVPGPCY